MATTNVQLPKTFVEGFHDPNKILQMKYHRFGATDLDVSAISLGTAGFCSFYGDYSLEECRSTLLKAVHSGINYIDTAPWYGHGLAEEIVGQCLAHIPRQAYYIATKVGRYEADPSRMFDYSASKIHESIDCSLKRLHLDYIDVIQIHDVEFAPSRDLILHETIPAILEAQKQGKVRYIGITGYPVSLLSEYVTSHPQTFHMILSYSRCCLLDQALLNFLETFRRHNVGIVNAAVHCMGLLCTAGPPAWHPASALIRKACEQATRYCEENGTSIEKLVLHFGLNCLSGAHTTLVGMNKPSVLSENLDVFYSGLTESEQRTLEHIHDKIFIPLKHTNWEGVELERFLVKK